MSLPVGTPLGPYVIVGPLGAGGMGEVYRATDTDLKRQVAIKVLPDAVAGDVDRVARFQREAEVLAALNHPHIAQIHGLARGTGQIGLVMELVEGWTLAERIARGAIPIDEALPIARQVAEALEAAHERGIIHRDLKPANIKLTPDGVVKVLDFGLAKLADQAPSSGLQAAGQPHEQLSQSPTITSPALVTGGGVLLGTAAYMSPEQARGKLVDRRSDMWSFGCVLYEMLTGRRAFAGDDVSETLASVLAREPDWAALPKDTPQAVRILLRRSLERDRTRRLDSAAAARLEIADALTSPAVGQEPASPSPRTRLASIAAAAALAVAIGAGTVWYLRPGNSPADPLPLQFSFDPPADMSFATRPSVGSGLATQMAVSPDGRHVVFVASAKGTYQLWLRSLGALAPRPLAGTDDAAFPFWSPDSRHVGFFAGGKLKKTPIAGGAPIALADAANGRGGTWGRGDVIVFAPESVGALQQVSAVGGVPQPATVLDAQYGEAGHRFPFFLPDGRRFLYTSVVGACCPAAKPSRIRIGDIRGTEARTIFDAESSVVFAAGHLLYQLDGMLMARPFDESSLVLSGDAFRIVEEVDYEGSRYGSFAASETGTLIFSTARGGRLTRLTWMDRGGREVSTVGGAAIHYAFSLSPDEQRVAVEVQGGTSLESRDIWIIDLARGTRTRLSFDTGRNRSPVWTPDGRSVVYVGWRNGAPTLRMARADGSMAERMLASSSDWGGTSSNDVSPDGRHVVFTRNASGAGTFPDIWALPLVGDPKPFPVVESPFNDSSAAFSPDGRWLAYNSSESAQQLQVYVQPFPPTGAKFQVSAGAGQNPVWRADGKELFFSSADRMMAVDMNLSDRTLAGSSPKSLFPLATQVGPLGLQYAVSKDGQRFLVNAAVESELRSQPIIVVTDWLATTRN